MKYLTIEDAVLLTGKSIRTIQRHCNKDYKKGKKLDIHLDYPIFTYEKSEKGGRRKLFSEEWLLKRFLPSQDKLSGKSSGKKKQKKKDKKAAKKKQFFVTNEKAKAVNYTSDSQSKADNYDLKDQIIDMLLKDKEALMEDKKALQQIIEKLTDNLLLEQKKVAQLEAERIQLLREKNDAKESKLSNMSMSEWWAKKQAETVEEEQQEEPSEKADNSSNDSTKNNKNASDSNSNTPKSFYDWLKIRGKMD